MPPNFDRRHNQDHRKERREHTIRNEPEKLTTDECASEGYDLFPVAETLQMMRLSEIEGGDIHLLEAGRALANAPLDERKRIFARHLLNFVPLAAHIRRILDERASHTAPKNRFSDELEDFMTPQAAEQTLRAVISWARYVRGLRL